MSTSEELKNRNTSYPAYLEIAFFDEFSKNWKLNTDTDIYSGQIRYKFILSLASSKGCSSVCRLCGQKILPGFLRIGYPTKDVRGDTGVITCWVHAICSRQSIDFMNLLAGWTMNLDEGLDHLLQYTYGLKDIPAIAVEDFVCLYTGNDELVLEYIPPRYRDSQYLLKISKYGSKLNTGFGSDESRCLDNSFLESDSADDLTEETTVIEKYGKYLNMYKPPQTSFELLPYQKEGHQWLRFMEEYSFHKGGCLGDEMGMGKTVQFVSLLYQNKRKYKSLVDLTGWVELGNILNGLELLSKDHYNQTHDSQVEIIVILNILREHLLTELIASISPALVVSPVAAVDQWVKEINAYTEGSLKTFVYHGNNRKSSLAKSIYDNKQKKMLNCFSRLLECDPYDFSIHLSEVTVLDELKKVFCESNTEASKIILKAINNTERQLKEVEGVKSTNLLKNRLRSFCSGALGGAIMGSLIDDDVIITTYQMIEIEYREILNRFKIQCEYCGIKMTFDRLVVHQKYTCGPNAKKTNKMALQEKKEIVTNVIKHIKIGNVETDFTFEPSTLAMGQLRRVAMKAGLKAKKEVLKESDSIRKKKEDFQNQLRLKKLNNNDSNSSENKEENKLTTDVDVSEVTNQSRPKKRQDNSNKMKDNKKIRTNNNKIKNPLKINTENINTNIKDTLEIDSRNESNSLKFCDENYNLPKKTVNYITNITKKVDIYHFGEGSNQDDKVPNILSIIGKKEGKKRTSCCNYRALCSIKKMNKNINMSQRKGKKSNSSITETPISIKNNKNKESNMELYEDICKKRISEVSINLSKDQVVSDSQNTQNKAENIKSNEICEALQKKKVKKRGKVKKPIKSKKNKKINKKGMITINKESKIENSLKQKANNKKNSISTILSLNIEDAKLDETSHISSELDKLCESFVEAFNLKNIGSISGWCTTSLFDLSVSPIFGICWARVVLDEAHKIKSRTNSTSQATLSIQSAFKWAVSGTPMQNKIGELYALLRYLQVYPYAYMFCKQCEREQIPNQSTKLPLIDGYFQYRASALKDSDWNLATPTNSTSGAKLEHTGTMYTWNNNSIPSGICACLELVNDKNLNCHCCGHAKSQHYSYFRQAILQPIQRYGNFGLGRKALLRLKEDVLKEIFLRRTKTERSSDVDLPELKVQTIQLEPTTEERDFYSAMFSNNKITYNAFLQKGTVLNNYAHIFDLITRLRQAVDHPYLLIYSDSQEKLGSNRISGSNPCNSEICQICQDEINDDKKVKTTCGHTFHKECCREYIHDSPVYKNLCTKSNTDSLLDIGCPVCFCPMSISLADIDDDICEELLDSTTLEELDNRIDQSNQNIDYSNNLESEQIRSLTESNFKTHLNEDIRSILESKLLDSSEPEVKINSEEEDNTVSDSKKLLTFMNRFSKKDFVPSAKMTALVNSLKTILISNSKDEPIPHKALVFSQFSKYLDLLEWYLKKHNIVCAKYVGSLTMAARKAILSKFRGENDLCVLLVSLKAGGEGINLQAADHVFIMDPWWNPATEDQAIHRTHRLGQKRPVNAIKYIVKNTVEERMQILQEKKRAMFQVAVEGSSSALSSLSESDIKFLFDMS